MLKLGIEVSQASVAKYVVRRRGAPSPTWRTFLRNHAEGIAAIDMFVAASASFRLLYVMMKALDSKSAVLVGQDWGSPVVYNVALMRPDLVRGVLMMCSPPSARGPIRPSEGMKRLFTDQGLNFYQSYLALPEAATEIMRDLRRFLLSVFYSTSGNCPVDKQWRWAWKSPETLSDTYTVPATLPPHLSQQALDYYVGEFSRAGIQPANNRYIALNKGWENTSFLDGAIVQQPALFLTGERDPSLRPLLGIDRQGAAFASLKTNFRDMREIIMMPGVGHTPPMRGRCQSQ